VFFGDSAGQPAQTRAKTLELVERNRVHVLTGPVAAFEAYAISDYVRQTETPMVISPAAADDITQRKTNPWFVRATMSGSQVTHPLGEYAAKQLGDKHVAPTTEESSLKSMGAEALGVITAGTYSAAVDTPTNRKWVQAMRAEYKDDPGYCTIGGYLGVLFIEAGMKGVNGRVEDKAAFIKALRAVQLPDTPQGPIRLDAYGNPIVNVYIRKVERQ